MKYVQYINSLLKEHLSNESDVVLFGQNIDAGSCLSGLTRGLSASNKGLTLNTQNSENSLVGVGFGLMLNEVSSIFFMKQSDFLLLGIDQIVNTYNIIRQTKPSASFTIFPVTMDSGYEGPQASLNNLDDFCSIAGVEGYSFTNKLDTGKIISKHLTKPGFRIMSVGQRLLQQEVLDLENIYQDLNGNYFQYKKGNDATIVCFNNALQYGLELHNVMQNRKLSSSLFSVNSHLYEDYSRILDDIDNTEKLILIDDTKSRNRLSDQFLIKALNSHELKIKVIISRPITYDIFYPCKDLLDIDYNKIVDDIANC
jgi:pyruvate/2-oxoglutarate/acetoin dehydrogenase E1 component